MEVPLGDTYYFLFTTRQYSDGAPTTLSGTPVLSVYEENNLTQITTGVAVSADYDGVTGLNECSVVATGANGYEAGKYYSVVITTGTVGGTSVVGEVVGHFRIIPAEVSAGIKDVNTMFWADQATASNDVALTTSPTNFASLAITATGAVGLNWGNVENQSTSVDLSATSTNLVDTATAVTNNVNADLIATQSNTVTFPAVNITGLLNIDDGVDISCSTVGRSAFVATGNGAGDGVRFLGGATGKGGVIQAGASGDQGLAIIGTNTSAGVEIQGGATNGQGLRILGNGSDAAVEFLGNTGPAFLVDSTSGVSINAPDGITANITGSITGNLSGSVNSVTSGVTASTVSDKTGYSISGTKTTLDALNDIAATDVVSSGAITTSAGAVSTVTSVTNAVTVGTINADVVNASALAADAADEIAAAVWDEDATGHQTQGTFGQAIGDPVLDATTIYQAVATDATGDNVSIDVVAIQADLDNGTDGLGAIKTDTAAILDDTGTSGVLVSDGTGAGQIALTAGAVDTVTSVTNQVTADVTAISGDTTAADRLEGLMDGIIIAQVNDASATTTAFAADGFTEATDSHFNGRLITFISGALTGQQTDITAYDAAGGPQGNQEFTVTALTEAPANNDFFVIH